MFHGIHAGSLCKDPEANFKMGTLNNSTRVHVRYASVFGPNCPSASLRLDTEETTYVAYMTGNEGHELELRLAVIALLC